MDATNFYQYTTGHGSQIVTSRLVYKLLNRELTPSYSLSWSEKLMNSPWEEARWFGGFCYDMHLVQRHPLATLLSCPHYHGQTRMVRKIFQRLSIQNHELVSFQTAQDCNAKVHLSCVAREAQVTVEDCSETGDSANWLSSWRYPDENIYILYIYTVHICK